MLLFVAGLASIIYLGLTAQPTSTVVLLPDADGGVGSVEIRSDSSARQSLASPYSNASVTTRGPVPNSASNPSRNSFNHSMKARLEKCRSIFVMFFVARAKFTHGTFWIADFGFWIAATRSRQ